MEIFKNAATAKKIPKTIKSKHLEEKRKKLVTEILYRKNDHEMGKNLNLTPTDNLDSINDITDSAPDKLDNPFQQRTSDKTIESTSTKSAVPKLKTKLRTSKRPKLDAPSNVSQKSTKRKNDSLDSMHTEITNLRKVTEELEDLVDSYHPGEAAQKKNTLEFQNKIYFVDNKAAKIEEADVKTASDIVLKPAARTSESGTTDENTPVTDILHKIRHEVQRAVKNKKTFTLGGTYTEPIRNALLSKDWIEKFHMTYIDSLSDDQKLYHFTPLEKLLEYAKEKKSSALCKSIIKSKLLGAHDVDFIWGDARGEIFKENSDKNKILINRSKKDFLVNWHQKVKGSAVRHPRSYVLTKPEHILEFTTNFRKTTAMNILKWVIETYKKKDSKVVSPVGKIPLEAFEFALNECCKLIKSPKADVPIASDYEWSQFIDYYYDLVHGSNHFRSDGKESEGTLIKKSRCFLNYLKDICPYIDTDGIMNIWLLKPIGSSVKNKFIYRDLQQILRTSKTHEGMLVQKFIEHPLLIHKTKFVIHVWFLISDNAPLTVFIYKDLYLKFSTQTYNLRKMDELSNSSNSQTRFITDAALPNFNVWKISEFENYLTNIGYSEAFNGIIYPGIKQILVDTIHCCQDSSRRQSFELKKAYFLLGEDFKPWLIDIRPESEAGLGVPVLRQLYAKVLTDVVKVILDWTRNTHANIGKFELLYRKKMGKADKLKQTQPLLKDLSTLASVDSFKQFSDRIRTTLKTLLQIIEQEKSKRRSLKAK